MYAERGVRVTDYKRERTYRVTFNAYHVEIVDERTMKALFVRGPDTGPWLDARHQKITKALDQLEKAILEAV